MLPPRNPEPDPEMLALARRQERVDRGNDRRRRLRRAAFALGMGVFVVLGVLDACLLIVNYGPALCERGALSFLGSAKAPICAYVAGW